MIRSAPPRVGCYNDEKRLSKARSVVGRGGGRGRACLVIPASELREGGRRGRGKSRTGEGNK